MQLGQYLLESNVFVAPMAGVTDRPFRSLCKKLGAGYAVSEMVTSRPDLIKSAKTQRRINHAGESGVISVQIAGTQPKEMAEAALFNIDKGAQVIDINMGCPAKKVCNKWAGSALMQDETLALSIIESVVNACQSMSIPVTLKMRTGWSEQVKNAKVIALAAQALGVQMITIHGRTRELGYKGQAEYDTIRQIKSALSIPVVANGDIDSAEKAKWVLDSTKADAVMIGRAAQGNPWIFRETTHYLQTGRLLAPPLVVEARSLLLEHLEEHYTLYGSFTGVRTARKHIGWYVKGLEGHEAFKEKMNRLEDTCEQLRAVAHYFDTLSEYGERLKKVKLERTDYVYE
jgi:tRNA-dihydrouridine synthase B